MTGKRCYMQRNEECWEQVNYLVRIYDTTGVRLGLGLGLGLGVRVRLG